MAKYLLFLALIFLGPKVFSYPQFSSFGYRSCLTCHYNPMGNGPLNDYGRAVAATAISSRVFYSERTSEEEIAKSSSFFYGAFDKNTWLRPNLDYRGIQINTSVGEDNGSSRYIHMQAVASIVVQSKDRSLYAVADIGHAPVPPGSDESEVRSREHYLAYRFSPNLGVYVGMMDIAYGIRIVDHTAYSRRNNFLAQNDQTHGALIHLSTESFEAGIHGFVGSLFEDSDLQQKGGSVFSEYSLTPNWHLGGSVLLSNSTFKEQMSYGVHSRNSFGKGSVILSEFGMRTLRYASESEATNSLYGMFRTQTQIARGIFGNTGIDYFRADLNSASELWKLSMGLQVFPVQRIEFRFDLSTTRTINSLSSSGSRRLSEDSFDLYSQVHLWF